MGIFYQRAGELYDQQRYDLAQRDLLRELEQNPDHADAHALLGMCQHFLKQKDEALASCQEAIRLAPSSAYAHYALGCVLVDFDRLKPAADSVQEALRLDPTSPFYHGQLSYIRWRQGRYDEALTSADAGLALSPRNTFCLNRRAMALGYLGRLAEAEEVIRVALAVDPENAYTLANCGWILMKRGQGDEAAQTLRDALRRNPQMSWARDHLIDTLVLLIQQKQSKVALKHFDESLERDPSLEEGRRRMAANLLSTAWGPVVGVFWLVWLLICLFAAGLNGPLSVTGLFLLLLLFLEGWITPLFWVYYVIRGLLLGTTSLGRRLLTRDELRSAIWAAEIIVAAAFVGIRAAQTGEPLLAHLYAALLNLIPAVAQVSACPPGWPRQALHLYLGALIAGGAALVGLAATGQVTLEQAMTFRCCLLIAGVGCSGLLGRALAYLRQRRAATR